MAYYGLRRSDGVRSTWRVFSRRELSAGIMPVGPTDAGETPQVLDGGGMSKPGCPSSLGVCVLLLWEGSPFAALVAQAGFDYPISRPLSPSPLFYLQFSCSPIQNHCRGGLHIVVHLRPYIDLQFDPMQFLFIDSLVMRSARPSRTISSSPHLS